MGRFFDDLNNKKIGATITRVMISLIILKDIIIFLLNAESLFGKNAIVPYSVYEDTMSTLGLNFIKFPFNDSIATTTFISIALFFCLLFLIGTAKVICGISLFFCLFELKLRNIYIMDGADNVIWIMLPMLALVPSKSILFNKTKVPNSPSTVLSFVRNHISKLAVLGITIQLSLIYFFTAISKLIHPIWHEGTALYYILRIEDFRASSLNILLTKSSFFVAFSTYITLLWEASFPILIWFKRTRKAIIYISILFHLGIFILMRVDNFAFIMISFYPILLTDEELQDIRRWATMKMPKIFTSKSNKLQYNLLERAK